MSSFLASWLSWKKTVAAALAVGGLLALVIAYRHFRLSAQNFEPTPPRALLASPARAVLPGAQDVSFTDARGVRLAGWYIPSRNGAAVVLVHGTNNDRTSLLPEIRFLANAGFGVLAYDGPGCGYSGGRPLWDHQAVVALHAAVGWLSERFPPHQANIGALGLSLGGYVLTQAAADNPALRAVVLEAAPPDIVAATRYEHRKWRGVSQWPAVWALHRSPHLLARPSAEAVIGDIAPRPVLVIGGDRDQTVPGFMTQRLFDRARAPKELWIARGALHGGYIEVYPTEYPRRVVDFFRRTLLTPARAPTPSAPPSGPLRTEAVAAVP